jgi:hypothetical protein
MKLKLEQILKPGADLTKIPKIDFNSPEVKESLECLRKCQEEARKRKHWTQEQHQRFRNMIINI